MSFFAELKRRNVFKVAVTYAVAAWVIIQVAGTLLPAYAAPVWVMPVFSTIVMLGWPLALVLAWAIELTPEGLRLTRNEDTRSGSPSGLLLNFLIMGVMAVIIVWLVVERSFDSAAPAPAVTSAGIATTDETEAPARTPRLPHSIAVLPFENLSVDANNAYFAAGIHDTVLLELSKISDMNVIARTSMLQYADTTLTLAQIAEELKVETIMEGSVQYAEGQVRITAQLIDPDTGSHIWSGNYDRSFADVFTIQSEIAQNIAQAIGAELLPQELQQIGRQQTASQEAYALYLQAKALIPNLAPFMDAQARAALHRAIELDPNFAEPYAMLAFHYALSLGYWDAELALEERETLARDYAEAALRINPDIGLAHGALAMLESAYLRMDAAGALWEQALATSPNDVDVLDDAIFYFAMGGQLERARNLASKIQNISPNTMGTMLLWIAYGSGDPTEFLNYVGDPNVQLSMDPGQKVFFQQIHAIYAALMGDRELALALVAEVEAQPYATPGRFDFNWYIYSLGLLGEQERAEAAFADYVAFYGGEVPATVDSVFILLGIGAKDRALTVLERITQIPGPARGSVYYLQMLVKNVFRDSVLDAPEFVAARGRFGLPLQ